VNGEFFAMTEEHVFARNGKVELRKREFSNTFFITRSNLLIKRKRLLQSFLFRNDEELQEIAELSCLIQLVCEDTNEGERNYSGEWITGKIRLNN
jgi:hypothetical protein